MIKETWGGTPYSALHLTSKLGTLPVSGSIQERVSQLQESHQATIRRLILIYEGAHGWNNYSKIPALEYLYFEDSYVLGISSTEDTIEFKMEFVLLQDHPMYFDPLPGEQYCYKRGGLKFANVRNVREFLRTNVRTIDANGEVDFGNIDSFVSQNQRYVLEGEWGKLDIESDEPSVNCI